MITATEFETIQLNRASLYSFVARLFERPLSQDDIETLARTDFSAMACGDEAIDHGLHVMERTLAKRNTGTRELLNRDYTSAFYGIQTLNGKVAIPYESAFEGSDQRLMGAARSRVYNIYKKQALKLAEGIDLPEDHLSFMCQFMAVMARRAVELKNAGRTDDLRQNLLLQQAFLREHVLSWYPKLRETASQLVEGRFYRGVMEMAQGVFDMDAWALKRLTRDEGCSTSGFDLTWWELPRPVMPGEKPMYPIVDSKLCLCTNGGSCGECISVCPVRIDPRAVGKKEQSACVNCGACVRACPTGAISMPEQA